MRISPDLSEHKHTLNKDLQNEVLSDLKITGEEKSLS